MILASENPDARLVELRRVAEQVPRFWNTGWPWPLQSQGKHAEENWPTTAPGKVVKRQSMFQTFHMESRDLTQRTLLR